MKEGRGELRWKHGTCFLIRMWSGVRFVRASVFLTKHFFKRNKLIVEGLAEKKLLGFSRSFLINVLL